MDDFSRRDAVHAATPWAGAPARLRRWFAIEPELYPVWDKLRRDASGVVSSTYEITARCNLRCEGCYFFEGPEAGLVEENDDLADWDRFFASEAARGVNLAYLAGAEPALEPERLAIAARHIPRGMLVTNGTRRIDPDLPFRIHVSLWGDGETSARLRGGDVFAKPLRLYEGDRRVVFLMTVSRQNIDQIATVAQACADHGATLTFSLFSAPETYLDKLARAAPNDSEFFRISRPDDNMTLTPDDRRRVREAIRRAMDDHPDTVIYSREFNDWTTREAGLFDIDPDTGIATNCAPRSSPYYRRVRPDFSHEGAKCCLPHIDCRDCRANIIAQTSMIGWFGQQSRTLDGFRLWVRTAELWARLNLLGWEDAAAA